MVIKMASNAMTMLETDDEVVIVFPMVDPRLQSVQYPSLTRLLSTSDIFIRSISFFQKKSVLIEQRERGSMIFAQDELMAIYILNLEEPCGVARNVGKR